MFHVIAIVAFQRGGGAAMDGGCPYLAKDKRQVSGPQRKGECGRLPPALNKGKRQESGGTHAGTNPLR